MTVLLRYHYFQPVDGRFHYHGGAPNSDCPAFSLIYSGVIPTREDEPTEAVLERLLLRHGADLRPHSRELRPIGTGDVLDLTGRGLWQVAATGFRPLKGEQLVLDGVH